MFFKQNKKELTFLEENSNKNHFQRSGRQKSCSFNKSGLQHWIFVEFVWKLLRLSIFQITSRQLFCEYLNLYVNFEKLHKKNLYQNITNVSLSLVNNNSKRDDVVHWADRSCLVGVFNALTLKLVSAIFYQIFVYLPNDSPLLTMKNAFYFI